MLLCVLLILSLVCTFPPAYALQTSYTNSKDLHKAHENNSRGVPIYNGQVVTVEGVVTVATGLIPEKIRTRKKSPFPKTYDPGYESLLISALQKIITDPNSPLLAIADPKKIQAFCYHPKDLGKPWFGQLMAGPQLMAYYIQINEWFKKYNVKLSI